MSIDNMLAKMVGMEGEDFEIVCETTYKNKEAVLLQIKPKVQCCPHCKKVDRHDVNCYYKRPLKTAFGMGYEYVIYRQRRYICKNCKHTFMEKNNIVKKYESLSLVAKKIIRKLLLKMNVPYTQLAIFTSISRQIIMKQQDTIRFKYIDYMLPEIISLDEICYQKNTPKYDYVIVDYRKGRVIAIKRDRRSEQLEKYFRSFAIEDRLNVKIVIMDQWKPYANIVRKLFPNAIIIADKFHFSRYITWSLRNMRVSEYKNADTKEIDKLLHKYWKLVEKPLHKGNSLFHNFIVTSILNHPDISDKFKNMLDIFNDFYLKLNDVMTREEATDFIEETIARLKEINDENVEQAISVFTNWKEEIINALVYRDENGKSYTNGKIEGINNLIKTIIKQSYGFHKHDRFEMRVLIVCNQKHHNLDDYIIEDV